MSGSLDTLNKYILKCEEYRSLDLSESDTRSKILDAVLKEILGWTEEDIEREGHVGNGYFDYMIGVPGFRFVVEAKRQHVELKLPVSGRTHSLQMLYAGNQEVIDQIRNYAFRKDVAFGVISNGSQFIVARLINTDATDWKKNKAHVFRSLEDIKNNFIDFSNLLSRESVLEKGGLIPEEHDYVPHIILPTLARRDEKLVRNEFSAALISVIDFAFKGLSIDQKISDTNILELCYVKNTDIDKYNSELMVIFEDNPPKFDSRIAKVRNTENTQRQIEQGLLGTEPIVLIGSKGCGKTTFIRYLFDVVLSRKEGSPYRYVYVDFKGYTAQLIRDSQLLSKKIVDAIEITYSSENLGSFEILKSIYASQIAKMKTGTWSIYLTKTDVLEEKIANFLEERQRNSFDHLKSVVAYLKTKLGKRPCIVLDNADQLSEEAQREVYLYAHSLNQGFEALLVLSLREGYFYRWRNKPPFDAFTTTIYHISAPPYREVLRKRFDYLSEIQEFPSVEGRTSNAAKLSISGASVKLLFDNISQTLFNNKNSDVLEFLEQTSYPNIRSGLEKLNRFLVSGHTKVESYALEKRYLIPIWEFFKSIALDADYYYHNESSEIPNLLLPENPNLSHFLKTRLLISILDKVQEKVTKHVFADVANLISTYTAAGYRKDAVIAELQRLLQLGLIETETFSTDVDEPPIIGTNERVKPTYAGRFYVREIIGRFFYLDLVLQDTPIFLKEHYDKIRAIFPESDFYGNRPIEERRKTVEAFMEYLGDRESKEVSKSKYNDAGLDANIVRDIIGPKLRADFERMDRRSNQ